MTAYIQPDGIGSSGICVIADSPWKDEVRESRNLAGAAGHVFNRWLGLIGMERDTLTVANTIWYPPPYLGWSDKWARKPSSNPECQAAVEECSPLLDKLISERRPKVLILMGNVALRRCCGCCGIEDYAGYVMPSIYDIPAIPTYHPSYVMKGNSKLTPAVLFAFKRAQEIANGTYKESKYDLIIDPPVAVVADYVASAGPRIDSLFVDIETPESGRLDEEDIESEGSSYTILRVGFSVRAGTAVTFPWLPEYRPVLQLAFDKADEFVEWADNRFDSRRLAATGLRLPNRIISGMWVWHWLQSDLRKGLGKVAPFWYAGPPWKQLNVAEPGRYNAFDVVIGRDCYEGSKAALQQ